MGVWVIICVFFCSISFNANAGINGFTLIKNIQFSDLFQAAFS